MDTGLIERIERTAEGAASALLGASAGFAVFRLLGDTVPDASLTALAVGAALLVCLACAFVLGSLAPRRDRFVVHSFELPDLQKFEDYELLLTDADRAHADELVLSDADRVGADELVLSDADRLEADELVLLDKDRHVAAQEPPLMLDDILAEIGPNARVVRLFDRKSMPTPGQLKSRIDHHLGQDGNRGRVPDASEALSEALAELRRSLR